MASETQILSRLSPNVVACPSKSQAGVGVPDGACLSQRDHHPQPPISPNLPTIYNLFMQNEPNFQKSQMNVSIYLQTAYENKSNWTLGENEPNSNPIKANFRKAQMNVNSLITKGYIKYDDFAVRKNKPNSNPTCSELACGEQGRTVEPISVKPKMSANLYVIEDYENETAFRLQKNKPNQTQSLVKDLIALVSAWMFISKTAKKSCARLWALLQCFSENFDKPGERKAECSARPKLRTDPMNLLGIMPAKEGKIDLKHSFCRSAFLLA